jgi:dihydrofolate reductase
MEEQMGHPMDLLLGRKTYDIFASYWPSRESPFNAATKYVASRTLTGDPWPRTVILRDDVPARVRQLKQEDGPELQVHGSGNLIQTLLKHDLVDEIWLKIFPVTLGPGKRLFGEGTIPASFTLVDSRTSPRGVIVATLVRSGPVETGSF